MSTDRRRIQIEAIADQIAQHYDPRYYDSLIDVAAEGNKNGWTVDVGYGSEQPGNWTRTEGIVLTDTELAEAVEIAIQLIAKNAG